MADIERFGRTFSFDDGVSDAQREQRIQNWMQKHAPDELKTPSSAPAQRDVPKADTSTDKSDSLSDKIAQSAGQGVLGGFGDEATAWMRAIAPTFSNWMMEPSAFEKSTGKTGQRVSTAGTFDERYDEELGRERAKAKDFSETNPWLSGGSRVAGALATVPFGAAALKAAPGGARLAALIAKHPFLASIGTGALSGGVSSFGEGEGGFEERMGNAGMGAGIGAILGPAAYGAAKGVGKAADWVKTDNRVADYLRTALSREKKLDPASPTFNPDVMTKLRTELAAQNQLKTDPLVADLVPKTTEASLLKPGKGSSELAESLYKRQYDELLPEAQALERSQFGRLHDAMDTSFGPDTFKGTDDALIAARRAHAQQGFAPAYAQNVRSPQIDDALDRLNTLSPNILQTAQRWARAERRPIGTFDPQGNIIDYNTQYLHDIKRSMDEVLGEQGRMNPKFNDMPYKNAKTDLNRAIMDVNDPYKQAMIKYGEDSGLIEALRKGREDVFTPGSVDKTGMMDADAIQAYVADPNIPQAQKDLFMTAAARAVREKFLGSDTKQFTHNWASFVNNPKNEANLNALTNGRQLGSWDLFRSRLRQENRNYMNATKATGQSATAARTEMMKEAEGVAPDAMAALGLLINPKAPSGWRGIQSTALRAIDPSAKMMNKTASILAKKGPAANTSLDEIERLLNEQTARAARNKRIGTMIPGMTGYALPYRED